MQIVRKKLSADEITPAGTRYNSDCDCVQTTSDGGTTWNDAPGLDPRHADSFRNPPLTTDDPRCDAAANMVAFLRSLVNADIAAATTVGMATAFIGLVTLFFPVLLIADLVIAIAGIIAGIGIIAIEAAFTDTVYDDLLCTFYAHIQSDGSMNTGNLTDFLSDVDANYDIVVSQVIAAHSSALGEVGWSNAGAAGSEIGDCSACGLLCYELDLTISDGLGEGFVIQGGTWTSGTGVVGANFGAGNQSDAYGYWQFPEVIHVEIAEYFYNKPSGSGANDANNKYALYPTATSYNVTNIATNTDDIFGTDQVIEWDVNEDLAGLGWDLNSGTAVVDVVMQKIRIYYRGGTGLLVPNC